MIGVGGAYIYGKQKIEAPGPLQEDKVVNIPARAGMTDIADILQREGVIDNNRWAFIGSVFALKARSELKPGEYSFQKNASLRDVIGTMVEGKVVQHAVTIPEGLTSEQIVARLSDNDIFSGSVREVPREGTLLPETYKFPRGTPRDQVIARMQQAQKRVLAEIWERRNPDIPIKTPEQLVTLASIVEKETGKAGRAQPGCRGICQSVATENKAAIGSDHHLWAGRRQGNAGSSDQAQRNPAAVAIQYLCGRRASAWTDRQSGARLSGSGCQSRANARSVLRRRWYRWPCL